MPDGFDEASFEAEPGAEDSSLPPILRFNALEEEMKMEALAGISSASAKPSYLPEAILHGLADCRLYLCFASLNIYTSFLLPRPCGALPEANGLRACFASLRKLKGHARLLQAKPAESEAAPVAEAAEACGAETCSF